MPIKDIQHDIVIRSLIKAGWAIVNEQVYLSIGTSPETIRRLYVDIQAQSATGMLVLIEVKSLSRSLIHQLMELLGQYLIYKAALTYLDIAIPLYVAIEQEDYQTLIGHVLGQKVMDEYQIPLLVYDEIAEVIQTWIPPI